MTGNELINLLQKLPDWEREQTVYITGDREVVHVGYGFASGAEDAASRIVVSDY